MNIFFYCIIFIIGIIFGSFYTLAVYRIPRREDIIHTHSYCPNCNHKLGFWDLIPVFSYIFLGGKCRYCQNKIRPRYLILEVLSGVLFVVFALALKLDITKINIINIIDFSFIVLYLTFIILIAGIDKENRKIEKSLSIYGIILSLLYIVYLCIIGETSIYRYIIYLISYIIILIFDNITLKRFAKSTYVTGILLLVFTMIIMTTEYVFFMTSTCTVLSVIIYAIIKKITVSMSKSKKTDVIDLRNIPFAYILSISNILNLIITLFVVNYVY